MCGELCTDNRFEIIAAYKKKLIEGTNIEASPEEMAVIDNILFRFWQMGWLPPVPHGRLIDADALLQAIIKRLGIKSQEHFTPQESFVCSMIDNSPIVIDAEDGEA